MRNRRRESRLSGLSPLSMRDFALGGLCPLTMRYERNI